MRTLLFSVFLLTAGLAQASEPVSKSYFGDIAIGGHDTVSYHEANASNSRNVEPGSKMFVVKWMGANWRFASQTSADKFEADPHRYRPSYNGHCANALSIGEGLVKTDGSVWEFFGEELFLFYAERGRKRWMEGDWQDYKATSDAAWMQAKSPSMKD